MEKKAIGGNSTDAFRGKPCKLHFIDTDAATVPLPVQVFLGKSSKMVPTQSIPSYAYAYDALENFKIGVIRAAALQALNLKSRTDPLRKLRRKFYTPESAWKPDWKTVDQKVFDFCDEFKTEFLVKLQQIKIRDSKSRFPRKSNLDAGDRWAIEWLHGSPQLLDCPTD